MNKFINREQALQRFDTLLGASTAGGLGVQGVDGWGKSWLLRELYTRCAARNIQVILVETDKQRVPNYWTILREIAIKLSDAMNGTLQALQEIENNTAPLDTLPGGGGIYISGNAVVTVGANMVGGNMIGGVTAPDNSPRGQEYTGIKNRIERMFQDELRAFTQSRRGDGAANTPVVFLFDNVDLATEEAAAWLESLLTLTWQNDFPALRLALTTRGSPDRYLNAGNGLLEHILLERFNLNNIQAYLAAYGLPSTDAEFIYNYSNEGTPADVGFMITRRWNQMKQKQSAS